MRRFLVLALTMALGLTTLVALPAAAHDDTDDKCAWGEIRHGDKCLTDQEYKDRRDHNDDKKDGDRDGKRRYHDRDDKWGDRDWRDKDRDWRDKDRKDRYRSRIFDDWFWDYLWDDPDNDNCGCLSKWETKRLERRASNAGIQEARQILWYLHNQDCMTNGEYKRLRRNARFLDENKLMDIIEDATECKCTNNGRYWMDYRDFKRLDRKSRLNERRLRDLLDFRGNRDCIDRKGVRRVDRWDDDLGYWDILDLLDWGYLG